MNKMKNLIIRILYIFGIPLSIISLYSGFYEFLFRDEILGILPIILGIVYWLMLYIKYPKQPIRKRW